MKVLIIVGLLLILFCLLSVTFETNVDYPLPEDLPTEVLVQPTSTKIFTPVTEYDDMVHNYYDAALPQTPPLKFPSAIAPEITPELFPVPTGLQAPINYVDSSYPVLPGIPVGGPAPAIGSQKLIDAVMSDWSQWANVGGGFDQRTRTCIHQGSNGGTLCGSTSETRVRTV